MKKIFYLTQLCLAFVLFQSASDSKIRTSLTPIHPFQAHFTRDNAIDTEILGNDGNLYITAWDLGNKSSSDFENTKTMCEKKIYPHMLLNKSKDINEFSESNIKPSLFKENGQCYISEGYLLKAKNGFSPDKFQLSVMRSHSKSSSYMPVGGSFFIVKKQARYIDAYKHVTICKAEAQKKGNEVEEDYANYYTYVTIKPYLDFMKECLTNAGYEIEENKK